MHSILVSDYMDTNPHAINHDASVRSVVKFLLKENISGAPVVNKEQQIIGFVSEKDCLSEVLNDAFYCDESPNIQHVMTKDIISTSPSTSIVELAQDMVKLTPRVYPVVENGKLVGMISRNAILNAILENNEDCYL